MTVAEAKSRFRLEGICEDGDTHSMSGITVLRYTGDDRGTYVYCRDIFSKGHYPVFVEKGSELMISKAGNEIAMQLSFRLKGPFRDFYRKPAKFAKGQRELLDPIS